MSGTGDMASWPDRKNKLKNPRYPGEPLYTVQECASLLRVNPAHFVGMMRHHPGLMPWYEQVGSKTRGRQYNLYRLSDARKWWKRINEEKFGPSAAT